MREISPCRPGLAHGDTSVVKGLHLQAVHKMNTRPAGPRGCGKCHHSVWAASWPRHLDDAFPEVVSCPPPTLAGSPARNLTPLAGVSRGCCACGNQNITVEGGATAQTGQSKGRWPEGPGLKA